MPARIPARQTRMTAALTALLAALLVLAGCSGAPGALPIIVVAVVDTATARPTLTPIGSQPRQATATSLPAVIGLGQLGSTAAAGSSPVASSATPQAGGSSGGVVAAAPATHTPMATLDPKQFGAEVNFKLEAPRTRYHRTEPIWFNFTITNLTGSLLHTGVIGVEMPDGSFHTSLSVLTLTPFEVLPWRDWVALPVPGSFSLKLALCFSSRDECRNGGQWVHVAEPLTVIIE